MKNPNVVHVGEISAEELQDLFHRISAGAGFEERALPFRHVVTQAGKYRVDGVVTFLDGGESFESETPIKIEKLR